MDEFFANLGFWEVIGLLFFITFSLMSLILGTLFFLKKLNISTTEIPLGKGKSVKLKFNSETDQEEFLKNYIKIDDFLKINQLISSEKDKLSNMQESFVAKSLRDSASKIRNLLSDLTYEIEQTYSMGINFLYSHKAYVAEQVVNVFRGAIKENHLTSRKEGSEDREDFLTEKSLNIYNIIANSYSEHWADVENPEYREFIPTVREIKDFFQEEKIKDKIIKEVRQMLAYVIKLAINKENKELEERTKLLSLLSEQFHLDDETIGSILTMLKMD